MSDGKSRKERFEKVFWICLTCAKLKGYRLPPPGEGHVTESVTKCFVCEMRTVVVDIEDLIPAWESL